MKQGFHVAWKIIFFALIASLGGFLFGFHTSVISGALLFLRGDFNLGILDQELIVSTLLIGALFGALFGGPFADRFGRKRSLVLTTLLFLVGTVVLVEATDVTALLAGRLITGLGIGIASMAVPLYIAEISPHGRRGSLVSLNQLMITIGILVAYWVGYSFSERGEWREMFGFAFFPLVVFGVGLLLVPESPSWKASLPEKSSEKKIEWRELFTPAVRRAFWVGIGISVFQQITGINTVIYYAPQIFQMAGFQTVETATLATLWIGIGNVLFTILSLWLIDWVGRRPLLLVGLIGMAGSLFSLAYFFHAGGEIGESAVFAVMAYVAFFAISLGPVAWLLISEIYPLRVRGRAMGVATFVNWSFNYLVSLTFLSLIQKLGASGTFMLYAIISLIGLWFVSRFVPETKGKTFEEIQHFWRK